MNLLLAPFRAVSAWWCRYYAEICAFVDECEGRRRITYLRSKDGTVPLCRLPNNQLLSLKKLQRQREQLARRAAAAASAK